MQTITGSLYQEDFNYGNPYTSGITSSVLPQFQFSGSEMTHYGYLRSTSYRRKDFTLQYLSPAQFPQNLDLGRHGGSSSLHPYYLMFPVMTWGETQILTMTVTLDAAGTLTYDRSLDGYPKDFFCVVVNGLVAHLVSHSVGHSWVNDSIALREGVNVISWVYFCAPYVPATTAHQPNAIRTGTPVTSPTKIPPLPRYLRLTQIQITPVTQIPSPANVALTLKGGSSWTLNDIVKVLAKPSWSAGSALTIGTKYSAPVSLSGGSTATVAATRLGMYSKVPLTASATLTVVSGLTQGGESYDGGMEIDTHAYLTVFRPPDTTVVGPVQEMRPLQRVSMAMNVPVMIHGRPVAPAYLGASHTTLSTASGYTTSAPPDPTSVNHQVPISPVYWWRATDLTGADGTAILSWPDHIAGLQLVSEAPFAPTVYPHEKFNAQDSTLVTYSRGVNFWNRYSQHMWTILPSTHSTYTLMWVGIMHQPPPSIYNVIWDAGGPSPAFINEAAKTPVYAGDNLPVADGQPYRSLVSFQDTYAKIGNRAPNGYDTRKLPILWNKPVAIFASFSPLFVRLYMRGSSYRVAAKVGSSGSANPSHFLLGRSTGIISPRYSSHMITFEVAFFDTELNTDQMEQIAVYEGAVYKFNQYK